MAMFHDTRYWFITSSQMPDLTPVALQAKQACMLDVWCRWQRPDYEEVGKSHGSQWAAEG